MSTRLPGQNPTAYLGIKETNPPQLWFRNRVPTADDYKSYDVGDLWIFGAGAVAYILVLKVGTVATWVTFVGTGATSVTGDAGGVVPPDGAGDLNFLGNTGVYDNGIQFTGTPGANTMTAIDLRNITKYVVDPAVGETEYQTIQAALDAANAAGGNATVYVRNGTYTEDLTLYDGINLVGASGLGDEGQVEIIGVHIPPAAGNFVIRNFRLSSATDIFNSAVAGTSHLVVIDAAVACTNGYLFNLVNWAGGGALEMFDVNSAGGTNDGGVNNTGGCQVYIYEAGIGTGVGNSMIISGPFAFQNMDAGCPISIQGTAAGTINGCPISQNLTSAATATIDISNSTFATGANQAITHGSANPLSLADVTIDSSNNPCIGGAGAGNLVLGSVTYLDDTNIAGTVTKSFATRVETGELKIDDADNGVLIATVGVVSPLGAMLDGELIIGSTGLDPAVGSLASAGGTVAITPGAGTINLEAAGGVAITFTSDAGNAVPVANVLNVLGGNNIGTVGAGNTLTINVNGTTDHTLQVGNATGSLTSLAAMVDGDLVIGSTGVDPVIAQLTAGAGIAIASAAGAITISATGSGLAWVEVVAAAQAMAVTTAYGANRGGGVTFTLPVLAVAGAVMEIVGMAGLWVLAQNAGQQVHIGNQSTAVGIGGSLTATNAHDCIVLRCTVANTTWTIQNMMGNLTVV